MPIDPTAQHVQLHFDVLGKDSACTAQVLSYAAFMDATPRQLPGSGDNAPMFVVRAPASLLLHVVRCCEDGWMATRGVALADVLDAARKFPSESLLDVVLNRVERVERKLGASAITPPAASELPTSRPYPDSVMSYGEQQLWLQVYVECVLRHSAVGAARAATMAVWRLRAIAHGSPPDEAAIEETIDSAEGRRDVMNFARQVMDPKMQHETRNR